MAHISVACTLSKAALEKSQAELSTFKQLVREVRQIEDGFTLRFDGSTENLMAIAQVIAQERLCCRFLQFHLIAEPDASPLRLEVKGENNTPQFLLEMLGFDHSCAYLSSSPC